MKRRLNFKPIGFDDMPVIGSLLRQGMSRVCDYTPGCLLLWAEYFGYEYCVVDDTLLIKEVPEGERDGMAFMLPVGRLPLSDSVALIADYCRERGATMKFTAIPEDRVREFMAIDDFVVEELEGWGDYLYEAGKLSTLSGRSMNKKRNKVNRFMADNPDFRFEPLSAENVGDVAAFFDDICYGKEFSAMAEYETGMIKRVLRDYERYGLDGAVLSVNGRVVAFTFGEVVDDTLYVHVEKMNHNITGAGETINKLFAEAMAERYAPVYINREEDLGDDGLRRAKHSYHPCEIIKKYNVQKSS